MQLTSISADLYIPYLVPRMRKMIYLSMYVTSTKMFLKVLRRLIDRQIFSTVNLYIFELSES
jgi:hypothetical protein